ncbi:fimbrial protein (plasmid) [Providencia sp. R33]|uniref:fimbrial protein n=1 Tax=Providencia sp. R33 TaxID=2828763 RepID=UPI001C5B8F9E|nr:fimbrial protein [Providencia sp. R33]QXX85193.1 fimbrial protein [Providencia sp. R33]
MKRKCKFITLVLPICVVLSNNSFAEESGVLSPITVGGGIINFHGSIVNTPCVIDNDDASQTVNLGQYRQDAFTGKSSVSSPVGFDIKLTGCATETFKNASLTFSGITVPDENTTLAPVASQSGQITATGVGIQILQNSKLVNVDGLKATDVVKLNEGDSRLRFQAQYIALADKVTVGAANASADFTITYQ